MSIVEIEISVEFSLKEISIGDLSNFKVFRCTKEFKVKKYILMQQKKRAFIHVNILLFLIYHGKIGEKDRKTPFHY